MSKGNIISSRPKSNLLKPSGSLYLKIGLCSDDGVFPFEAWDQEPRLILGLRDLQSS